ncbi:proteasome assembly chaperone family protein [Haloarchaeobius sp. HRN-SO-5]|uniref:proteasome assembly chaperone family protein n=1 Tax=Haloarchaeobius sp. HRN-SO-5 TaxID=3446118 RepID=UPI003EC029CD
MEPRESFTLEISDGQESATTLIIGQPHLGMAGVTAMDYLVRNLESSEVGHIAPEELPAIAPFEDGVPRHHSRFYTIEGTGLLALVGELFIPVGAARPYTDALLELAREQGIDEIVILHGIPFPHGPEEHEVFYVSTPAFRERRLTETAMRPLKGGFLDGVAGEVVTRSLDEAAPETGVFITPTHPPGPDVDASLRLLDALEATYGFDLDETELRELGEQLNQYYQQLSERLATVEGEEALGSHDYPEDRMFM